MRHFTARGASSSSPAQRSGAGAERTSHPVLVMRGHPSVPPRHGTKALPPKKIRGGGAPRGAYALLTAPHPQTLPPADAPGAASATDDPRYRGHPLRAPSPFGAPSRHSPGFTPDSASGCAYRDLAAACATTNPFY